VLLAVDLLAVHAAVLDEKAGRAIIELDDAVVSFLAAVGTGFVRFGRGRRDPDTAHDSLGPTAAALVIGRPPPRRTVAPSHWVSDEMQTQSNAAVCQK